MSTHYLHPEIREKNGAYGGGAVYSGLDGTFSFYSYRDPKPLNSSEVFKKSVEWAATKKFTDRVKKKKKIFFFFFFIFFFFNNLFFFFFFLKKKNKKEKLFFF